VLETSYVLIAFLTAILAIFVVVITLMIIIVRLRRMRQERRHAEQVDQVRPLVLAALRADPEHLAVDRTIRALAPMAGRTLQSLVISLVPKLRGVDRAALVQLMIRTGAVENATRGLGSRRAIRRLEAVEFLGTLGLTAGIPAILPLLKDRDSYVRMATVRALGHGESGAAVVALLQSLDDDGKRQLPRHSVTMAAVRNGASAQKELLDVLRPMSTTGPHGKAAAAQILGWLGVLHATDVLHQAMDNESVEVQLAAIDALGRIGAPDTVPRLEGRLSAAQPAAVRAGAATALARLHDPAAVPALCAVLDAEHPVALAAAVALAELGPAGHKALIVASDKSAEARELVARLNLTENPILEEELVLS
jgi:hypothetical protein